VRTLRRGLFWIHLAAGSIAGVVILILCATGVLLAFQPQVLRLVERNARRVPSAERNARRVPSAERIARRDPARTSPTHLGAGTLLRLAGDSFPGDSPSALTISSDPAEPAMVAFGRGRVLFLDPATGAVLGRGSRAWRAFFVSAQDLHRWLSLGGTRRAAGEAVTGAASLLFLGIALSGLYIWWPRLRGIRRVSSVALFQPAASASRRARDFHWHNVVGIWSALPLIVITVTALPMSYRWAGDLVYRIAGGEAPAATSEPARADRSGTPAIPALSGERAASLDALSRTAEAQSAGWRAITLRLPAGGDAVTFTIEEGRFANRFARSQITVDARTGEIRKWEPYAQASGGRRARSWMRFLHTGETLGVAGQLVAASASLGGCVLVVTGLSLVLRRLRSWLSRPAAANALEEDAAVVRGATR
jgi:uncharacterized iron-regulated membrane protein